ncbi:MAG: GAF domain-containing protein, partial [Mycolicibacterium frederiksbergense]|nr:GAF domain-containing protein [Mycolicibacterium frederiksbergense]
ELARRLRVRLPWLPVVLASGYSHILAREDDHGFEVLHKPYSAEQVGRILSRVIGRPLATSEPQMSAAGALREPLAAIVDGDRLAALERYGVLDTSPQASFDEIVMLARTLCAAPTALISFVAEERQWFKARSGFGPTQTSLSHSVCIHALQEPGPLVIPDLRADTRTNENPLVTGNAALRFYAGAPLRTLDGHTLGTLCILDTISRPQGLSSEQTQGLQALAALVMAQLELQRELRASRLGTTAPSSD